MQGTQTTLRVPPRVMLVGRSVQDVVPLVQQLGREGYLVLSEVEPDVALSRLRSARFEFVLLDIDAAGAGSAKFVSALRSDSQLEGLPVLAISRSDNIDTIESLLEAVKSRSAKA